MSNILKEKHSNLPLNRQHESCELYEQCQRRAKRPRGMSTWEKALSEASTFESDKGIWGLSDLFGGAKSSFFTLRLDHREGGMLARHEGEERILIFQSNRTGAVAKIIYSCTPADEYEKSEQEEEQVNKMSQAKIHVLDVKEANRGFDLGSLLFTEALSFLRQRYIDYEEEGEENEKNHINMELSDRACSNKALFRPSIHCELDAEEDSRRHNKLVGFYESLGCSVKPNSKILYLNNNDGETYRKVPMEIILRSALDGNTLRNRKSNNETLLSGKESFLPVRLLEASGKRVGFPHNFDRADWVMIEDNEKRIELRTTKGVLLRVNFDGECIGVSKFTTTSDTLLTDSINKECSKFRLIRFSDVGENESNEEAEAREESLPCYIQEKHLWLLRSVSYGTYLSLDPNDHMLYCTRTPSFWQVDLATRSLISTTDTPPRRRHYRLHWAKQTFEYAVGMKKTYVGFRMKKMSLRSALDLSTCVLAYPFEVGTANHVSLRTLCFRTAEYFRNSGHPDWVQLLALVYALGGVVKCIDMKTAKETEEEYDWTITSRSRVLGCSAPNSVVFDEFRCLNSDEKDPRYNCTYGQYKPHCGLENVVLTWSGPEYMYHMLKHNDVAVPQEGLKMLRLASLSDWHTKNLYHYFADDDDFEIQRLIADFDELILVAKRETLHRAEMTWKECGRLWESHYGNIASKYNMDGDLNW